MKVSPQFQTCVYYTEGPQRIQKHSVQVDVVTELTISFKSGLQIIDTPALASNGFQSKNWNLLRALLQYRSKFQLDSEIFIVQ